VDLYTHSLIRLHGVVLNELSTGTTLPYHIVLHDSSGSWILNRIDRKDVASCCYGNEGEGIIENLEMKQELQDLYIHSPKRLHGVVLNEYTTCTTYLVGGLGWSV
jgi:hypothetical protein